MMEAVPIKKQCGTVEQNSSFNESTNRMQSNGLFGSGRDNKHDSWQYSCPEPNQRLPSWRPTLRQSRIATTPSTFMEEKTGTNTTNPDYL
jgi:hypothetical protein